MRADLPKMLQIVSDLAEVEFVIAPADNQGVPTVKVYNATLGQVLDRIFLPLGLRYEIDGRRVIVRRR